MQPSHISPGETVQVSGLRASDRGGPARHGAPRGCACRQRCSRAQYLPPGNEDTTQPPPGSSGSRTSAQKVSLTSRRSRWSVCPVSRVHVRYREMMPNDEGPVTGRKGSRSTTEPSPCRDSLCYESGKCPKTSQDSTLKGWDRSILPNTVHCTFAKYCVASCWTIVQFLIRDDATRSYIAVPPSVMSWCSLVLMTVNRCVFEAKVMTVRS